MAPSKVCGPPQVYPAVFPGFAGVYPSAVVTFVLVILPELAAVITPAEFTVKEVNVKLPAVTPEAGSMVGSTDPLAFSATIEPEELAPADDCTGKSPSNLPVTYWTSCGIAIL